MSFETVIDEPIKVWAFFDHGIFPIAMNWRRRLVKFDKLIFSSSKRVGEVKIIDLVCASETACYELEYDSSTYGWKLKKVMDKVVDS